MSKELRAGLALGVALAIALAAYVFTRPRRPAGHDRAATGRTAAPARPRPSAAPAPETPAAPLPPPPEPGAEPEAARPRPRPEPGRTATTTPTSASEPMPDAPGELTLQGVVLDATTGLPIEGAQVLLGYPDPEVVSGPDGRFALTLPRASVATARLRVAHPRYVSFAGEVPGDAIEVRLQAVGPTGWLEIACADDRGVPLPAAAVEVDRAGDPGSFSPRLDAGGRALLEVAAGYYEVRASLDDHGDAAAELEVPAGERRHATLTLGRESVLVGRVRGATTPPLILRKRRKSEDGSSSTSTSSLTLGADGTFRHPLNPGAVEVTVLGEGASSETKKLTVPPGTSIEVEFIVAGSAPTILGRVRSKATGRPIEGARVEAADVSTTTDAAGAFELRLGLQDLPEDLDVSADWFAEAEVAIDRAAPLPIELTIDLEPAGRVRAHVVQADGKPAARIPVCLDVEGGPRYMTCTDDEGEVVFPFMRAGKAEFHAMARETYLPLGEPFPAWQRGMLIRLILRETYLPLGEPFPAEIRAGEETLVEVRLP